MLKQGSNEVSESALNIVKCYAKERLCFQALLQWLDFPQEIPLMCLIYDISMKIIILLKVIWFQVAETKGKLI